MDTDFLSQKQTGCNAYWFFCLSKTAGFPFAVRAFTPRLRFQGNNRKQTLYLYNRITTFHRIAAAFSSRARWCLLTNNWSGFSLFFWRAAGLSPLFLTLPFLPTSASVLIDLAYKHGSTGGITAFYEPDPSCSVLSKQPWEVIQQTRAFFWHYSSPPWKAAI